MLYIFFCFLINSLLFPILGRPGRSWSFIKKLESISIIFVTNLVKRINQKCEIGLTDKQRTSAGDQKSTLKFQHTEGQFRWALITHNMQYLSEMITLTSMGIFYAGKIWQKETIYIEKIKDVAVIDFPQDIACLIYPRESGENSDIGGSRNCGAGCSEQNPRSRYVCSCMLSPPKETRG